MFSSENHQENRMQVAQRLFYKVLMNPVKTAMSNIEKY